MGMLLMCRCWMEMTSDCSSREEFAHVMFDLKGLLSVDCAVCRDEGCYQSTS